MSPSTSEVLSGCRGRHRARAECPAFRLTHEGRTRTSAPLVCDGGENAVHGRGCADGQNEPRHQRPPVLDQRTQMSWYRAVPAVVMNRNHHRHEDPAAHGEADPQERDSHVPSHMTQRTAVVGDLETSQGYSASLGSGDSSRMERALTRRADLRVRCCTLDRLAPMRSGLSLLAPGRASTEVRSSVMARFAGSQLESQYPGREDDAEI